MIDFIVHILGLLVMVVIALVATTLVVAGFIGVGALFAHFHGTDSFPGDHRGRAGRTGSILSLQGDHTSPGIGRRG